MLTLTWKYALQYQCPVEKCGAEIGEMCVNIAEKKKGNSMPTRNPHPERLNNG